MAMPNPVQDLAANFEDAGRAPSGGGRLNPGQVARYREQGFLAFQAPVFSPDRFTGLKTLFEELVERYGANDLDMIHIREPRLLDFLLSDDVVSLVAPLIGPDIGLWSSHFISKPPRVGRITPWHEDRAYWDGRISSMDDIVTVWLALDAADIGNGSMGVIPGSHRQSGWSYEDVDIGDATFDIRIKPGEFDEQQAFFFTLNPNECSLHDARIIHGAHANRSERRRAGYTMRYFPTTSSVPAASDHKLWLVRGRDHAGNSYVNA